MCCPRGSTFKDILDVTLSYLFFPFSIAGFFTGLSVMLTNVDWYGFVIMFFICLSPMHYRNIDSEIPAKVGVTISLSSYGMGLGSCLSFGTNFGYIFMGVLSLVMFSSAWCMIFFRIEEKYRALADSQRELLERMRENNV